VKEKTKQVHFCSTTDQIEIALQEILKEPNKKVIHICGKEEIPEKNPENPEPREPREPPQPDPKSNSKITPEKLLSLCVELYSREQVPAEQKDFKQQLMNSTLTSSVYQEAILKALEFQKEYKEKIQNPNQRGEGVKERIETLRTEIRGLG
jgi:hypothetical protein